MRKIKKYGIHKNVVQFFGSQVIDVESLRVCVIVMEHIEGITRGSWKRRNAWTTSMEAQYKSGLIHIERAGVRRERENEDENVMVTRDGTVKIIDFGTLARA